MSYHPGAETAAPARLGRYELIGQLATGGMAEIHLARLAGEAGFEKIVVVKRLLPELVASKQFVAMFLDEGKLVARIDHPNVCEVHELGRDGAEYFFVMPYLDGVPVTDFIARPRDPDRAAQLRVAAGIVVQACAGLHHAHELRDARGAPLGLVHRDVSPSNLFVTAAGVVKVLDFGVAKVRGAAETEAGTIKGKTQYMAPEQLLGEPLDRRCDVFALGIVLFELATHQRLFKRASDYLAARAILEEDIPRADAVDPAVRRPLADVIAKALARKRDDRFADARALAAAVEGATATAPAAEIASALADWHGEDLSALRTRQARVIDDARSTRAPTTVPLRGQHEPSQVATTPRLGDSSQIATMPRGVSHRPRLPWLAGGVAIAGAATIALFALPDRDDARAIDPAVANRAARADAAGVDAAVIDAPLAAVGSVDEPAVDPRPAEATVADKPSSATKPPRAARPGMISIDSTPFATIYVDGKRLGVTPLVRKSVAAGTHRLRAVLRDGRHKELEIDIKPGKLAAPIVLTW